MIKPGIHDIPLAKYLADPAPAPSLSSSLARTLLDRSPWHAWCQHPKLGALPSREKDEFDIGSACHALVLEGEDNVAIIDADDWRTKDAKLQRDDARIAGKTPLLRRQYDAVQEMAKRLTLQLVRTEDRGLLDPSAGRSELTMLWQEPNGVWCRARPDWLRDDQAMIADYKTTANAAPEAFIRSSLFSFGYDIQAALYLRGLRALTGKEGTWRWVVQETAEPFALSVIAPTPELLVLADKKAERAIHLWGECLKADRWPGYSSRTAWATLPAWQEERWLEREVREDNAEFLNPMAAG